MINILKLKVGDAAYLGMFRPSKIRWSQVPGFETHK